MPKSVNKVILVGNVGKDPEVKYTPGGMPVARFSVATSENYKDRNDEWQERTEWHSIVAWQRLAEIVGEYVRKGSKGFKAVYRRQTSNLELGRPRKWIAKVQNRDCSPRHRAAEQWESRTDRGRATRA